MTVEKKRKPRPSRAGKSKMALTGYVAERHAKNYIDPYVDGIDTHTVLSPYMDIPADSKVSVRGWRKAENGHYLATVIYEGKEYSDFPISRLIKPVKSKNMGLEYEANVVKRLNDHGLMNGGGAGTGAGNDIHFINKVKEVVHQGEVKLDHNAAFGQISLHYKDDTGWHIPTKAADKFPLYANAVVHATVTVNGEKIKLTDQLNEFFAKPDIDTRLSGCVYSDALPLQPANQYLYDHHVEVLHIGNKGTFRAGRAEEEDPLGVGLPAPNGHGQFRVRQKHPNSLTVQFLIRRIEKSDISIDNDEHLEKIKKALGHE